MSRMIVLKPRSLTQSLQADLLLALRGRPGRLGRTISARHAAKEVCERRRRSSKRTETTRTSFKSQGAKPMTSDALCLV